MLVSINHKHKNGTEPRSQKVNFRLDTMDPSIPYVGGRQAGMSTSQCWSFTTAAACSHNSIYSPNPRRNWKTNCQPNFICSFMYVSCHYKWTTSFVWVRVCFVCGWLVGWFGEIKNTILPQLKPEHREWDQPRGITLKLIRIINNKCLARCNTVGLNFRNFRCSHPLSSHYSGP